MDKQTRKIISEIAHEAHMMGRIYHAKDEKENPAEVYQKIEEMIEFEISRKLKAPSR